MFETLLSPYSLLVSMGAALGLGISAWQTNGDKLFLVNAGSGILLAALLGARLDFVWLHGAYFGNHPEEILQFWLGGLGWCGGLLGGGLVWVLVGLFSRRKTGILAGAYLPLLGSLSVSLWLATWFRGGVYGPPTDAVWGILTRDEFGVLARRFPLPLLGAFFSGAALVAVHRLRIKRWLAFPAQRGVLGVLMTSLVILGATFLRVDPGPTPAGLRRDSWSALVVSGISLASYLFLVRRYRMNQLLIDPEQVTKTLTNFIRDVFQTTGRSQAVIGVSGGIDSALSAYLTVKALGEERVTLVRMPYQTSSPESLEHAQLVIEQTGAEAETVPISGAVDEVLARFPDMGQVRRGNVMARMRMIILYDRAAAKEGLVVGTGNKSETLLGYSTLHGDGAFDLNPLADLYKDQVNQLSSFLGIPREIIDKAPSADLWKGQTDEEELGFTYEEVDQLLYLLVEEGKNKEACLEAGFEEAFVEEVVNRVLSYRFKSKLPPAASIGQQPLENLEELPAFSE